MARISAVLPNAKIRSSGRATRASRCSFLDQRIMITADHQQLLNLLLLISRTHRRAPRAAAIATDAHGVVTRARAQR